MYFENGFTARLVRQVHDHPPIEPPRPQERPVEHVRLIRRGQHDDAFPAGETVHLGEDLIQRLLLLARATESGGPACTADGIELVNEDDRWRILARLLEQIAHPRSSYAHDHLHEFRRAHGEERHPGFACDGFRQQGSFQSPVRRPAAHPSEPCRPAGVFFGLFEKIHDLDQLVLGLVDAGHIIERDFRVLRPGRSGAPDSCRCP